MNIDLSRFWLDVVQWVVMLALAVSVWLRKPGEDALRALAEHKTSNGRDIEALAARLTQMEAHMQHMATSEKLKELEGTVKEIGQRAHGIAEGMGAIRSTVVRIEDFLLKSRLP